MPEKEVNVVSLLDLGRVYRVLGAAGEEIALCSIGWEEGEAFA